MKVLSLQAYSFRFHILTERFVMLHEQKGGPKFQQRLDLHPKDRIDIVHGLIPNVQMQRIEILLAPLLYLA